MDFENPLFEWKDGTPLEIDQESQLSILYESTFKFGFDCSQEMAALAYMEDGHNVDYKSALDRNLATSMAKEYIRREDSANEYSLIFSSPHIDGAHPQSCNDLSNAYVNSTITDVDHDDTWME